MGQCLLASSFMFVRGWILHQQIFVVGKRAYAVPNRKSRWHDIPANVKLRSCFCLLKNFEKRSVKRVLWPDYVIPKYVTSIIRVYKIVIIIIIIMMAAWGLFGEADRYSLFIFIKNVIQFEIVCASIKYVCC